MFHQYHEVRSPSPFGDRASSSAAAERWQNSKQLRRNMAWEVPCRSHREMSGMKSTFLGNIEWPCYGGNMKIEITELVSFIINRNKHWTWIAYLHTSTLRLWSFQVIYQSIWLIMVHQADRRSFCTISLFWPSPPMVTSQWGCYHMLQLQSYLSLSLSLTLSLPTYLPS